MYIQKYFQKRLIISVISVLFLAITVMGSSYALFMDVRSPGVNDQVLKVGELQITYIGGQAISLPNGVPLSDSDAFGQTDNVYTFGSF